MLVVGKWFSGTDVVDFAGVSIRAYDRDGIQFLEESNNSGDRYQWIAAPGQYSKCCGANFRIE